MLFVLAALLLDGPKLGPDPPALTIRLVHPREQGNRLLALFEGARAPHPAAALAGYKRAKGGDTGLGKAVDAGITALNPGMVAEMATLDDATLGLGWSPDGRLAWGAVVPRDDGTFAAYATAAALTDGKADDPLDGLPVDRLGPKATASVAARAPAGFLLASSRDELASALRRSREPLAKPGIDSGWLLHVDPKALATVPPLAARRAGVALVKMGSRGVDAAIRLEGETLLADVVGRFDAPPALSRATIPPRWLDAVPAEGTLAAFAFALDPSPATWNATFDLLDSVERVDPARANLAPLRLRINLLASAAVIKPDIDLWPRLVGLSAIVTADPSGKADGVLVQLHARDEPSAKRLQTLTLPRLLRAALKVKPEDRGDPLLLVVDGRPLSIERRGDDVAILWGRAIAARTSEAVADPSRSAGPALRDALGTDAQRFAAVWPGRLPALALPEAPPAVWVGRFEGSTSVDRLRVPGLKAIVRRVLDRIPFDPPPDASTNRRG